MATSRIRCLSILRKKFLGKKFSQKNIIVIHHNTSITSNEEDNSSSCVEVEEITNLKDDQCSLGSAASRSEGAGAAAATAAPSDNREPSAEESAAIKIQAIFRGHLARRAFRALKSLVKLQAVARGVCVRRQARMALNCMHALVRLQVRVRARHLLSTRSDD